MGVSLLAASVQAIVADILVPETVKTGDTFDIILDCPLGQGRPHDFMLVFGCIPDTAPPGYLGTVFGAVNLYDPDPTLKR